LKIFLHTLNILQNNILEHQYTIASCSAMRHNSPGILELGSQSIRHSSLHIFNSPKIVSFQAGFETGKQKEIGRGQVWALGRLGQSCHGLFRQKLCH